MARVLVIDDNPDIIAVVELALNAAGHQVVASTDPSQVAELAANNDVDAVILDVMMPRISGYEALRSLRDQPKTGGLPILFLSAHAEGEDRVRGLREGADDFLSKPFVAEELVLRVERLISQRGPMANEAGGTTLSDLEKCLAARRVVGHLYLGRYQALEVVGEGATGLVFRGWDPWLKRPVALKTLRVEQLLDAGRSAMVSKLMQEAVTSARFSHPNIVSVYDVGEGGEIAFIAMEYVDGTSLSDCLVERGRLPAAQVIPLTIAVTRGLAAAHAHGVVHNDVKPGNVLLGKDASIKVTDFGVARLVTSVVQAEGKLFGTPGYLPPEALMGEPYTEAGDFFGLGAILYQCLTGVMPFADSSVHQVILKTVKSEIPSPRSLHSEILGKLSDLVMDLLQKDPDDRLATADQVLDRLAAMPDSTTPWQPQLGQRAALDSHISSRAQLLPTSQLLLPEL